MNSMRYCLVGLLVTGLAANGLRVEGAPSFGSLADVGYAIRIYSPYEGGPAVAGNHLLVQVQIAEFRLDPAAINRPAQPGVGYWTLAVDGVDAGLAVSDMLMVPNALLPRLEAGKHTIRVELHTGDGSPLPRPAFHEQSVTLANAMVFDPGNTGTPTVQIILPADGATMPVDRLAVKVRLTNFRPDARRLNQPGAGGGTWWLTVDGAFAGLSMSEILDLPNDTLPFVAPGPHTLAVSLHDNAGQPVPGSLGSQ
ncbi:MAG TPA: hypothetical protein VM536_02105, partial [Chloroflexia bacterium]|nr:hypothetical protein [Chloroflexia bacterium]